MMRAKAVFASGVTSTVPLAHQPVHLAIDDRPERLHQVVDQHKRVAAVGMHQAEARMQPGRHDRARDAGAQHGVAVVEKAVQSATVACRGGNRRRTAVGQ